MTERTCSIDTCERQRNARGLCPTHYSRWRRVTLADPAAAAAWKVEQEERAAQRQAIVTAQEKACTKCLVVKPKSDFSLTPKSPDGRHSWCKQCLRDLAKGNYDPGAARTRHAELKSDPEYVANRKRVFDRWRAANPEAMRAATARWRRENAQHVRDVNREWAARNRQTVRLKKRGYNRARSVRKRGAGVDYAAILAEHGMTCHICGLVIAALGDLHFDHVIPLVHGGAHHPDNIRPAHAICNMRKGSRIA